MCIDGRLDRLSAQCEQWPREAAWLVRYIKTSRFAQMMDDSLRGDRRRIDRPVDGLQAVPRGTVLHWLSGNVPVLSVLSALMSIMTYNRTVLKLSSDDTGLTQECLTDYDIQYVDATEARTLSGSVDVRVAWGGHEAVDAIANMPRKWGCQDIMFGPKLSLALVDRPSKNPAVARAIAKDVMAHNQMGCNSCQTVVVEGDGQWFAHQLATELRPAPFNAERWARICRDRCDHYQSGKVLGPMAPEYTVLYKDSAEIPTDPAMGHTVYVRTIDKLEHVQIPEGTQTVGTTRQLPTLHHVDRIVPVGQMSEFTVPWDGVYPMERMIRWVSTSTGR